MCMCTISYPKRAASSAIPEEGIFLLVFVLDNSVLKQTAINSHTTTKSSPSNYHLNIAKQLCKTEGCMYFNFCFIKGTHLEIAWHAGVHSYLYASFGDHIPEKRISNTHVSTWRRKQRHKQNKKDTKKTVRRKQNMFNLCCSDGQFIHFLLDMMICTYTYCYVVG